MKRQRKLHRTIGDVVGYKVLDTIREKTVWDTQYLNSLPNASFAIIEPSYLQGLTSDKRARHLPHHTKGVKSGGEDKSLNIKHLRIALQNAEKLVPVTNSISKKELRERARKHLLRHARRVLAKK